MEIVTTVVEPGVESENRGANRGPGLPQPHGGVLYPGQTNRGGPGRPKDKVVQACAEAYDKLVPLLSKIAIDESNSPDTRIRAIRELGDRGIGTRVETILSNEAALLRASTVLAEFCVPGREDEAMKALIEALTTG